MEENENIVSSEEVLTENVIENNENEEKEVVSEILNPETSEKEQKIEEAKSHAKWYVLHTFSGYENVAKENLEIVIGKYSLQERIFDIVIPMEDVVEEKNGKKKVVSRKVMPGYILVKMIYGDDIWHAVTRTRGITGFAGPKGRPLPITDEEIRRLKLEKVVVKNIDLAPNDKIEIIDGALNGFIGTVISVDLVAEKCRVMVEMFGRETPVDLLLTQIRKI